MTAAGTTQGVAVILVDAHGRLLLHLRDDKEGIAMPGTWSIPGGAVEGDESSLAAAVRELREETGREVARLNPFASVPWGDRHLVHIFCGGAPFSEDEIVIGEGQAFRFFSWDEVRALHPVSPFALPVLAAFVASPLYDRCRRDAGG